MGTRLETHGNILHASMKPPQCENQLMSLKTSLNWGCLGSHLLEGRKIGCFAFRMEQSRLGKNWKINSLKYFLLPLSLLSAEHKLSILSNRKLSHFMTLGKDSNFCCANSRVTTWITWSRCKALSKVSRVKLICYWMLQQEVLYVKWLNHK